MGCVDDGEDRGCASSSACTENCTVVLDVCGFAKRTDYVCNLLSYFHVAEPGRGKSNFLYYEGDGTLIGIGPSYGEWHTLAFLSATYDDEMSCLAALGDKGCFYFEFEYFLRKLSLAYYFKLFFYILI